MSECKDKCKYNGSGCLIWAIAFYLVFYAVPILREIEEKIADNSRREPEHGTADAKAPVAAKRERDLEIIPGTSDPQQEGPPVQP